MKNLDEAIAEWAHQEARDSSKAGWPSDSPIWRLKFSPGLASQISGHRFLWWPRSRAIARISRASHQLTPTDRIVLIADAKAILGNDGKPLKDEDFCRAFGISLKKLSAYVNRAKTKLRHILRTYA